MMRVLFTFEANQHTGFGHAARCAGLAEELMSMDHCVGLCCFESDENDLELWGKFKRKYPRQYQARFSKRLFDSNLSTEALIKHLDDFDANWLVMDNYSFSDQIKIDLNRMRPNISQLEILDKQKDYPFARMQVNHNCQPQGGSEIIEGENGTKQLNGTSFFLGRPGLSYSDARSSSKPNHLLITMGGSDIDNYGAEVAKRVLSEGIWPSNSKLTLACTSNETEFVRTRNEFLSSNSVEILYKPDLLSLYASATHVICSGGVTALETLPVGLVPVIIVRAANQACGARRLDELGVGFCAENIDGAFKKFKTLIEEPHVYEAMRKKSTKLIDCYGPARIIEEMMRFLNRENN